MTCRILIADDSPTIQKVIKIAFSPYVAEVFVANDLGDAVAETQKVLPDLIIIDAGIEGLNSPDDLKRLTAGDTPIPVVLLAGSYEVIDEELFRRAGFSHIVKKPFESSDIIRLINTLVTPPLEKIEVTRSQPSAKAGIPPPPTENEFDDDEPSIDIELPSFMPPPPRPDALRNTVPPPPINEEKKRGSKVFFGDTPRPTNPQAFAGPPKPEFRSQSSQGACVSLDQEELARLLRKTVEEYCERHFSALAKEVISQELKRLVDERARILND